jgi:predicted transcriptional regulator
MGYRSRTDIIAKILEIAQGGVLKTRIMYGAFLSFPQLREYLKFLQENDLLEHSSEKNLYLTTGKGKRFLKSFREMQEMLYPRERTIGKIAEA